jgi:hypothetical protein
MIQRIDLVKCVIELAESSDFSWMEKIRGTPVPEARKVVREQAIVLLGEFARQAGDRRAQDYLIRLLLDRSNPRKERDEAGWRLTSIMTPEVRRVFVSLLYDYPEVAAPAFNYFRGGVGRVEAGKGTEWDRSLCAADVLEAIRVYMKRNPRESRPTPSPHEEAELLVRMERIVNGSPTNPPANPDSPPMRKAETPPANSTSERGDPSRRSSTTRPRPPGSAIGPILVGVGLVLAVTAIVILGLLRVRERRGDG